MRLKKLGAFLMLSAGYAMAGTILSVSPNPSYSAGVGTATIAVGWTQTVTYSNVSISAVLTDDTPGGPLSGTELTAYLMNAIGPSATSANEVVAPATITGLPASFSNTTLFSGLTLGPGTYYLVLAQANQYISVQYSSGTPVEVDGTVAFPPAFSPYGSPIAPTITFSITGTQGVGAVPEPAAFALAGIGLLAICGIRRYR